MAVDRDNPDKYRLVDSASGLSVTVHADGVPYSYTWGQPGLELPEFVSICTGGGCDRYAKTIARELLLWQLRQIGDGAFK